VDYDVGRYVEVCGCENDRIFEEGRELGRDQGYDDGREHGYDEGLEDGEREATRAVEARVRKELEEGHQSNIDDLWRRIDDLRDRVKRQNDEIRDLKEELMEDEEYYSRIGAVEESE
jgi:flagellar biosynthesis/type III secretory pathway protein FliH